MLKDGDNYPRANGPARGYSALAVLKLSATWKISFLRIKEGHLDTTKRRKRPASLMTGSAYMEVEVFETLHPHELAEIVEHQSYRITATCLSSGHPKTLKYNGRFDGSSMSGSLKGYWDMAITKVLEFGNDESLPHLEVKPKLSLPINNTFCPSYRFMKSILSSKGVYTEMAILTYEQRGLLDGTSSKVVGELNIRSNICEVYPSYEQTITKC
ncbi:hypothetical protein ECG_08122 [Echinococcus granulosus]|uniref:CB1 cannabinoid receptor-interacting protein 1 n=1 Tax=Echinococcus granulosus TaxID=6210 RepID=A0A068WZ51_ECHGR|nr:hypothetical protein ECG_08122 [Echinococcus granulosus]CDS23784.1 hypothetical protein EgrG_002046200 [Echinococcus granulosus]